ncbi:BET1 homolog [Ctenocephalides felis]|uniref:BET1 homolog n=1 Tax=Ctenocephalides felis TaxID=7515 RepID=UPI000E6E1410|nr:BET1 homolog [Ctenocephalides felis]
MRRSHGNYEPLQSTSAGFDHMEEENERMTGELKDKIGILKSLSIDIGNEVKYQDKFLKGFDDDMDNTGGFLGNTMRKVKMLGKGGHNYYMVYMFLFAMFVFFVLYLTIKFR